ncbi:acetylglutamate kinase [Paenibacillus sp. CC-CFT747]|nr:acetylglutamate kinase [Paenibacillus sp. CC-CFT747]
MYWTRLTINSIVGKLPDEKETTARLLRNPDDFAAALEPYYGKAADRFGALLKDHLVIAAELVKDLQAGRKAEAAEAEKRWYRNADDIAALLARINPNWTETEWKKMLHEHLKLVAAEAATRLAGNYKANVDVNERMEAQAMEMADTMTYGVLRQFPMAFEA